ncbi:LysE family translocator [Stappia indica]|uniref:LysE family translocator n=1 Tax=Stappia indica TaxID=538381 RepID=UPI001CD7E1AF|nr:LysE family translocator [Stappia indica]MCA1299871.1 LysE family translocator [Stappia indica]
MDITALIVFASALFVAAVIPGPGIAAIVARVLSRGRDGALAFCFGVALGDVIWLGLAVAGLAVVANTFATVFLAIKYLGAAYLVYLAWKMWRAPADAGLASVVRPASESRLNLVFGGLAVTLGNPKVIVFYLALLPNIIALETVTVLGYVELSAVTFAVLAVVLGGYCLLAERARGLMSSPRAVRLLNRVAGSVMAGAAVAIATR